jgi:hypothetical protein
MTLRDETTFADMWTAIMTQLRTITHLTEDTCFWFLPAARGSRPQPPAPADVFVTVAPDGGTFDEPLFHGGGGAQLTVNTGFTVTVHRTWHLDAGNVDNYFLLNSDGVAALLMAIINGMTGFDPTTGDGHTHVRELIRPTGFTQPWRSEDEHVGGFDVQFELSFDIDTAWTGDPIGDALPPAGESTSTTTTPAP